MTLEHSPHVEIGRPAPRFKLKNVDGSMLTRDDVKGENGLLVAFICNHCPYVHAVIERLCEDAKVLQEMGIGVVAINSNDAETYPEDSYEEMLSFSKKHKFTFPYLYDETQKVAQQYGAVCTPDFFGFDEGLHLHYRGRLDSAVRKVFDENNHEKELLSAMVDLVEKGRVQSVVQYPSMGCSIKWKEEDKS